MFITTVSVITLLATMGVAFAYKDFKRHLRVKIDEWFKRFEEELNVCAVNHQVTLISNMWHDINLEGFYLLTPRFLDPTLKLATDNWYYYNPMTKAFYIAKNQTLISAIHIPDYETMDRLTQAERDEKAVELQDRLIQNLVYKQNDVKDITLSAVREMVGTLHKTILLHYGMDKRFFFNSAVFAPTKKY